ncbi:hypothetical protein [Halobacillus sp. A5]|uniref:hypothetical protein n=1 Tax=Halobacillus sp. A5 TaxID=2880263 RepID=UPI0020A69766|nr:hypothetical protein [Halobacillus sp. A5]MCP3028423.1 hypothetical protein [Halobacillus sp. A5]
MKRRRKNRKSKEDYTFIDVLLDILFSIPEILIFLIRIIVLLGRGIGRLLHHIFDII